MNFQSSECDERQRWSRRDLLTATAWTVGAACRSKAKAERLPVAEIMTVRGPIPVQEMGLTLSHEHVLVDFIGADKVSRDRYDPDDAFRVMLPFLRAAVERGIRTLVECTPMYLGRDPILLRRLSEASGLHLLTNTGLYKAPYLPRTAATMTADDLADAWTLEYLEGIEGTGIRPGFIKIAVNPGRLLSVQKKIVSAACRTSLRTGMAIACHTGDGPAAMESLVIAAEEGLPLDRYIVVHADGIADASYHSRIAEQGAWVSFDAVGTRPARDHVQMITRMTGNGHGGRLLLSHDAGWYNVGDPNGGRPRSFTALTDSLFPALRASGFTNHDIRVLTVRNPQRAFALRSSGRRPRFEAGERPSIFVNPRDPFRPRHSDAAE